MPDTPSYTDTEAIDAQLIEQARTDAEAFGRVYDATYDQLFYYILRRCGDYHLALDITSEVYLKALKHLNQYSPRPGIPFIGWLYRIARNEIAQHYRKKSQYTFVELVDYPELIEAHTNITELITQMDAQQDHAHLHSAIQQLSAFDQTLIRLRYMEEKTIAEISAVTKKKEGTIKSRLHRVIKKLRASMQRIEEQSIV
jgi:RNA polymerase sigma-70 factor, ECF subfamily